MLSDPRYIMSIPFPVAGTITFNALCGANITAAKEVRRASGKELADALFKAVEDIRAAQRTK